MPTQSDGLPLPEFKTYKPTYDEVAPEAKLVAAQAIEKNLPEEVINVIYTQYFGYSGSTASIEVLADGQRRTESGGLKSTSNTYAVDVARSRSGWDVTDISAAHPPSASSDQSALMKSVLGNDRITLPAAARADVASGRISDQVLRSMNELAKDHAIEISVISSGHPIFVYGTDRRSDHPPGYAYDIGAIDGKLVVNPATRRLVAEVMREAMATGAYQVGGPVLLSGSGYFSDDTHSDHIHVGFAN